MNRLVIIGNGFDLAHGLHTSYKDFIDWYWEQRIERLKEESSYVSDDPLCRFIWAQGSCETVSWKRVLSHCSFDIKAGLSGFTKEIDRFNNEYSITKSLLLGKIIRNIESKGWTDIESDYYALLKDNADSLETCKKLNEQLYFLREKLAEYLKTQTTTNKIQGFIDAVNEDIVDEEDVAISERQKMNRMIEKVDETLFLNFNYTNTIHNYKPIPQAMYRFHFNPIHGSLDKPEEMIFGYGDEMDKYFQALIDRNENALLENSKSIKYLETSYYRDLLSFIEGCPFQVYIMGHSCGNSDRTLLNTIFEHQNCISIKPFCYINEKGEDNYSELTRNIYRNFTDKKLFRDRVVNKERCTTLDGQPLVGKEQLASQ